MEERRLSPLAQFELLRTLVQELYQLPVALLPSGADVEAFCGRHCFRPAQRELTGAGLRALLAQLDEVRILHVTDGLHIHLLLFQLEGTPVAFGPFCTLLFSQRDAKTLLAQNGIADALPQDFLSYSSRYPFLPETRALRLVRAVLHTLYPAAEDRPVAAFSAGQLAPDEASPALVSGEERPNYALLLEQRHACERDFRQNIREGNQKQALLNLGRMERDVSYLKRIGSTLESEKIGSAIARTVARLAAMDGGLPGIVADRISSQNAKDIQHAKTVDEIAAAKTRMVCDYCTAVRAIKKHPYSALVQSVLYEMERNFSRDISLSALAGELAVSKNYLIQRFHAEVGMTPIQYLTRLRMEQAALLLEQRNLSIQDISSAVGIPDSNYFTKLFKKAYQMTPAQYRKTKII